MHSVQVQSIRTFSILISLFLINNFYSWNTLKWSPCVTHTGALSIFGIDDMSTYADRIWPCYGLTTRHVECQQSSASGEVRKVDNTYCIKVG